MPKALILRKRKFNPFIVGYTMAFVTLAAVGYYLADNKTNEAYHRIVQHEYFTTDLAMYDLPRINLNLQGINGHTTHIRIDISLEVAKKDMDRIEGFKPRITDRIVTYMRDQNFEEISPPEAMHQLHQSLLKEVDNASRPIPVRDVIFRQFLVM